MVQHNLDQTVHRTMSIIERFGTLLATETEALKKDDFSNIDAFTQSKMELEAEYKTQLRELAQFKDQLKSLPSHLQDDLKRGQVRFNQHIQDNLKLLNRKRDLAHRLLDLIVDAARRTQTQDTYNNIQDKTGRRRQGDKMISSGVNESI